MSKRLIRTGCIILGVGVILSLLIDFLPVEMLYWLRDPFRHRTHPGYFRVIPADGNSGFVSLGLIEIGFVVLVAGLISRRRGK